MMISFLFTTWNNPLSWLISLMTWSLWPHVEIEAKRGELWGAIYGQGVRLVNKLGRIANCRKALEITVPATDYQVMAIARFLSENDGKPYDLKGAMGLGFGRDWQNDNAWFCSELAAASLIAVGYPGAQDAFGKASRVTPRAFKAFLEKIEGSQSTYLKK